MKTFNRLFNISNDSSCFIFGPRGTGKSFWLKKQFKYSIYLDLLDSEIFTQLNASPNRLEMMISNTGKNKVIILDEVQKIPKLLDEVHRLIENKGFRFILTGSSARKLKTADINLLAGRAYTYYFYPLTATELGDRFDLQFSLQFGHLPSVYNTKDPSKYLKSYVMTYLKEEVQQEGITRNLGAFNRFLESASFSQGEVLNISDVARDCHVNRKTVENFFFILEDLLLSWKIPVFTKKAKRKVIQHPKFYFYDVGVYRTIRPKGLFDSPEEIDGAALETLILQELIAINDIYQLDYEVFYWRTVTQLEVDFILYGEKGLLAFEIKRKSKLNQKDFRGLKAFKQDYPMAKCYIFYGGKLRLYENDCTILPIQDVFSDLPRILSED